MVVPLWTLPEGKIPGGSAAGIEDSDENSLDDDDENREMAVASRKYRCRGSLPAREIAGHRRNSYCLPFARVVCREK